MHATSARNRGQCGLSAGHFQLLTDPHAIPIVRLSCSLDYTAPATDARQHFAENNNCGPNVFRGTNSKGLISSHQEFFILNSILMAIHLMMQQTNTGGKKLKNLTSPYSEAKKLRNQIVVWLQILCD